MTTFTPTVEQDQAVEMFSRSASPSLAIEAGAGTGKTATLKLLAESTTRRGQYLAFNKAIVEESKGKMPGNVNCATAHALAFRTVGRKYAHRLRTSARMKSWELAQRLGINPVNVVTFDGVTKQLSPSFLAGLAMRGVERFCQTDAPAPTWRHVPWVERLDPADRSSRAINEYVARSIEHALVYAWADLTNTQGSLPYKHSHYLKQFQLDDPFIPADFILFDEAQDANPVMVAIVAAQQTHAQLVWVGDSQQQIYSFTGAVNALAQVPADQRAFLTHSFRFGPAIADVANRCLTGLRAELRIEGHGEIASVVEEFDDPDVILTRTNAEAIRHVLGCIEDGKRCHLVGGGREIASFARGAAQLMNGERTAHAELACFDSWSEVRDYVQQDEQGKDLALMVRLIDEFGVGPIVEAAESVIPEEQADLIVSTAHKAKGREWEAVQLSSDFPDKPENEELRLLYVACTRARLRLDIANAAWFRMREEDGNGTL